MVTVQMQCRQVCLWLIRDSRPHAMMLNHLPLQWIHVACNLCQDSVDASLKPQICEESMVNTFV